MVVEEYVYAPMVENAEKAKINEHPILFKGLSDYLVRRERDRAPSAERNEEEHLYLQFLLNWPRFEGNRLTDQMPLQSDLVAAMKSVCSFAHCLAAMGGRHRVVGGKRYWLNMELRRRIPRFISEFSPDGKDTAE